MSCENGIKLIELIGRAGKDGKGRKSEATGKSCIQDGGLFNGGRGPFSLHAPLSSPSVDKHSETIGDESGVTILLQTQERYKIDVDYIKEISHWSRNTKCV